ncbi:hypothetical protein [Goodfellowiella coeruleoviolacea]|uniref:Uncharacterized protein n=1 Tax=Goodfellowiella coeruleoviolacea TaxID=334858 RepID=A0AAE3GGP1_9PSEU|nr:hypothetical protein [Goodfellowiella coeruleoviolacea]MCP2167052.1 hypothetical protein [Goodfellowiella coeruleoviolacea]
MSRADGELDPVEAIIFRTGIGVRLRDLRLAHGLTVWTRRRRGSG